MAGTRRSISAFPERFPFTRGIQPTMYRGRLWTMRQYAGSAPPPSRTARYRYLLAQGVSGLSVAFDLPTQMGYDSDHELAAAKSAASASRSIRSRTWRSCSTASRSTACRRR